MSLLSASAALRSGFAALRTNPLRTFLSALGVVIGIGAVISVLALSDGVESSIRKQLAADGRVLTLRVSPRTMDFVDGIPMPRASYPTFGTTDATSLGSAVARFGTADIAVSGAALVTVAPDRPQRAVLLSGMQLPPVQVREHPPVAGRFFTAAEGASGARVLVISDPLAAALATTLRDSASGPTVLPVGQTPAERRATIRLASAGPQPTEAECRALVGRRVTIASAEWQIIGVMPPQEDAPSACTGKPATGAGRATSIGRLAAVAPASAAMQAMMPVPGRPLVPGLVLTAARVEDVPALRAAAERWLAGRYGGTAGTGTAATGGWKDRVDLASYERESEGIRQGMLMFRLLMSAITGISLVVGGVGIMNVLLATVTERTREIGISKAVGARRRDVLAQYLAESVAISAMGAAFGTVLGYAVAQLVAAIMRSQLTVPVHAGFSLSTLLVAVGAPIVVGLAFGMYPALRAARLSPIDAIRHE